MKQLVIFLILTSALMNSQVIKDTILGKPKFVKESVVFLNDSGPYTFLEADDEYGHAMIMTPKNLRESMRESWFETDFCRYINNETYYDKNRNITKETWYYKSGEIVDEYVYKYDHFSRLITEKSKNKYSERSVSNFYEGNSKTAKFKELYYKRKNEAVEKFRNNMESFKPLFITKFDSLTKTDSIFSVTNKYMKSLGDGSYTEAIDSIYHQKLVLVKKYDPKFKVIEEKKFKPDDYIRKKVFLETHMLYEYDEFGKIKKQTNLRDGKQHSYLFNNAGKVIEEMLNDEYGKTLTTAFTYNKDHNLEQKITYYGNKVWNDIRFEYKNNYITKLFYLDKFGREDEQVEPTIISFKYKFDKQKNWTEIIKNVNGKDLYKWIRTIEYY